MAKDCLFPVAIDDVPTPVEAGDTVLVSAWNKFADASAYLQSAAGITGTSDTSSLFYMVDNTSSINPGHRHSVLWDSDGAEYCISGGTGSTSLVVGGVTYTVPSAAPTTGSLLQNNGSGVLTWGCHIKASASLSSAHTVNSTTIEEIALDTLDYETVAGVFAAGTYSLTPGIVGYYLVLGRCTLAAVDDTETTYVSIYKNGALYSTGSRARQGVSTIAGRTIADIVYLDADDYVTLAMYNGDDNNRNTNTGADTVYLQLYGPL